MDLDSPLNCNLTLVCYSKIKMRLMLKVSNIIFTAKAMPIKVQAAVGCIQLCAGQEAACEAGVYAMRTQLVDNDVKVVLLVDAANAFNSLNREAALQNIHVLCPTIAPMLTNTYRNPARLFISGENIISCEGTTQGDPLAMVMYALAMMPLIHRLGREVTQSWYADDASSAGGRLGALRR